MSAEAEEIRRAFQAYCERGTSPRLSWEARLYLKGCQAQAKREGHERFLALLECEMHDHEGDVKLGPFLHEAIEDD